MYAVYSVPLGAWSGNVLLLPGEEVSSAGGDGTALVSTKPADGQSQFRLVTLRGSYADSEELGDLLPRGQVFGTLSICGHRVLF